MIVANTRAQVKRKLLTIINILLNTGGSIEPASGKHDGASAGIEAALLTDALAGSEAAIIAPASRAFATRAAVGCAAGLSGILTVRAGAGFHRSSLSSPNSNRPISSTRKVFTSSRFCSTSFR